jgi:hypothetical protein
MIVDGFIGHLELAMASRNNSSWVYKLQLLWHAINTSLLSPHQSFENGFQLWTFPFFWIPGFQLWTFPFFWIPGFQLWTFPFFWVPGIASASATAKLHNYFLKKASSRWALSRTLRMAVSSQLNTVKYNFPLITSLHRSHFNYRSTVA